MGGDTRPIGVFDSGLGGLTGVRELMELLPGEDIIYLGDTGRVPYGGRSRETIIKYARQDMAFLRSFDIKAILVACGTVSTTAIDEMAGDRVFGVAGPAVEKAAAVTKNGKVGLIATAASIRSGTYERLMKDVLPEAEVFPKACPLFVPLVENGRISRGDVVIETVAREYLTPLKGKGIDTLILGCTHYPLLTDIISDIMGGGVTLVNSGAEGAKKLAGSLARDGLLSGRNSGGKHSYYVTDTAEGFSGAAALFLRESVAGVVKQVSLDMF